MASCFYCSFKYDIAGVVGEIETMLSSIDI